MLKNPNVLKWLKWPRGANLKWSQRSSLPLPQLSYPPTPHPPAIQRAAVHWWESVCFPPACTACAWLGRVHHQGLRMGGVATGGDPVIPGLTFGRQIHGVWVTLGIMWTEVVKLAYFINWKQQCILMFTSIRTCIRKRMRVWLNKNDYGRELKRVTLSSMHTWSF